MISNNFRTAVRIQRDSVSTLLLVHREHCTASKYRLTPSCKRVPAARSAVNRRMSIARTKIAIEAKGSGLMTTLVRRLIPTGSMLHVIAAAAAAAEGATVRRYLESIP